MSDVCRKGQGRVREAGIGGGVVNARANKHDEYMSTEGASGTVRRSPRRPARKGTAAAVAETEETEGDRDMELEPQSESDSVGSAGSK